MHNFTRIVYQFYAHSLTHSHKKTHSHTYTMENATAIKILQEAANIAIKSGCFGLVETSNIINALTTVENAIKATGEKPTSTADQKSK